MAQQTINIGASPNDGTGTPLRTAFQYTNSNFSELYTAVGPSGNNIVCPGSATITGNLTVDTSTLKVDSANDRVGIGTATPAAKLIVRDGLNRNLLVASDATQLGSSGIAIGGFTDGAAGYAPLSIISSSTQFGISGSTAMTLNATGLGVGGSPLSYGANYRTLAINATDAGVLDLMSNSVSQLRIFGNGFENRIGGITNVPLTFHTNNAEKMRIDSAGNVGIGVTPSYKLDTYTTLGGTVTEKRFANRTANKIIVKRYFSITADTALFSVECGTAGANNMAAFEINVFATGTKVGSSSDRQFYGKFYVTRNLAGTFTITSAFSSGSAGAFNVAASGTSLNVNGIFSVISDGSACVEITGYIGGRDTIAEANLTVTMP